LFSCRIDFDEVCACGLLSRKCLSIWDFGNKWLFYQIALDPHFLRCSLGPSTSSQADESGRTFPHKIGAHDSIGFPTEVTPSA
jgi:hypothetical protein